MWDIHLFTHACTKTSTYSKFIHFYIGINNLYWRKRLMCTNRSLLKMWVSAANIGIVYVSMCIFQSSRLGVILLSMSFINRVLIESIFFNYSPVEFLFIPGQTQPIKLTIRKSPTTEEFFWKTRWGSCKNVYLSISSSIYGRYMQYVLMDNCLV